MLAERPAHADVPRSKRSLVRCDIHLRVSPSRDRSNRRQSDALRQIGILRLIAAACTIALLLLSISKPGTSTFVSRPPATIPSGRCAHSASAGRRRFFCAQIGTPTAAQKIHVSGHSNAPTTSTVVSIKRRKMSVASASSHVARAAMM